MLVFDFGLNASYLLSFLHDACFEEILEWIFSIQVHFFVAFDVLVSIAEVVPPRLVASYHALGTRKLRPSSTVLVLAIKFF